MNVFFNLRKLSDALAPSQDSLNRAALARRAFITIFLSVLALPGCDDLSNLEKIVSKPRTFDPRELQEPEEVLSDEKKSEFCIPNKKGFVWPSSAGAQEAIEPGEAVFTSQGSYAFSHLVSGIPARSEIGWVSPKGSRVISLGAAFGQSAPAQLAFRGQRLHFVHFSSDAGHFMARLGEVHNLSSTPEIHWGPRVEQGRDTSLVTDLALSSAGPVIVWDEPLPGSARSQIKGFWSDSRPENAHLAAKSRRLSALASDSDSPQIVSSGDGFYLGFLSYPAQKIPEQGSRLVQEPLSFLQLGRLSPKGAPIGATLTVNSVALRIIGFDLSQYAKQAQLIFWHYSSAGALLLTTVEVGNDGIVAQSTSEIDFPSLGAFELFTPVSSTKSENIWVLGPSTDAGSFLAQLSRLQLGPFERQSSLNGQFPLVRGPSELVFARPRGLGFELSIARCDASNRDEKKKSLKNEP